MPVTSANVSLTVALPNQVLVNDATTVTVPEGDWERTEGVVEVTVPAPEGEPEKLAAAVKGVWDAIAKVRKDAPKPASRFAGGVPKHHGPDGLLGHHVRRQDGAVRLG